MAKIISYSTLKNGEVVMYEDTFDVSSLEDAKEAWHANGKGDVLYSIEIDGNFYLIQ